MTYHIAKIQKGKSEHYIDTVLHTVKRNETVNMSAKTLRKIKNDFQNKASKLQDELAYQREVNKKMKDVLFEMSECVSIKKLIEGLPELPYYQETLHKDLIDKLPTLLNALNSVFHDVKTKRQKLLEAKMNEIGERLLDISVPLTYVEMNDKTDKNTTELLHTQAEKIIDLSNEIVQLFPE